MIQLPDAASLPKSLAAGPESWGEAWSNAAATTSETMRVVENTTGTVNATYDAYAGYIDEVEKATGVRLHNPMDVDLRQGTWDAKPNPTYSGLTGTEWRDQRIKTSMDEFEQQRQALAAKYPAQARLIQLDIDGRVKQTMQDAERRNAEAMNSPELGTIGKLTAGLAGGLYGSARDPVQFLMLAAGGGEFGVAKTVLGRIGRAVVTEGLLNGGQEAILQAASQDRKANAGLDHGLEDALKNVGVAATFGALFGGSLQGGKEFARVFKMGEGGAERAARVIEGNPQPGDIEAVAAALNVDIAPHADTIARGFDERVMDDYALPRDATPDQARIYEAAAKYADDPDNHPPPELVERMIADEQAGPARTLSADDYERIYGGDQTAIDEATTKLADLQKQVDEVMAVSRPIDPNKPGVYDTRGQGQRFHGSKRGLDPATLDNFTFSDLNYYGQGFYTTDAMAVAHGYAKGKRADIFNIAEKGDVKALDMEQPIPEWLIKDSDELVQAAIDEHKPTNVRELYDAIRETGTADGLPAYEIQEYFDSLRYRMEEQGYNAMDHVGGLRTDKAPHSVRIYFAPADSLELSRINADNYFFEPFQTQIAPERVAEPLTPQAEAMAADAAGDIVEPPRDKNGNPENYFDFIGVENADGTFSTMSAAEALKLADEPNFLADLMEACKL